MHSFFRLMFFTSVCFFATSSVSAKDYYLQPFSATSPWNTTLNERLQTYKNISFQRVDQFSGVAINHTHWSIPFYQSAKSDKYRKILVTHNPKNKYVNIKMPKGIKSSGGLDSSLVIYDPTKKIIHEFYKFDENRNRAKAYKVIPATGSGIASARGKRLGTRAFGGSAVGGLMRVQEINNGMPMQHALAIGMGNKYLKKGYVWPATAQDGNANSTYYGWIPMGSLITIHKSVDINRLLKNPLARKIAHTLQQYGGYVVDRAGNGPLVLFAEPGSNPWALWLARAELAKVIPHLVIVNKTAK